MGIQQWNHCVQEISIKMKDPAFILQVIDKKIERKGEKEVEEAIQKMQSLLQENLREIDVKETEGNMEKPIRNANSMLCLGDIINLFFSLLRHSL